MSQLTWELIKNNNSFMRKNLNGIVFSAEPGNLFNKHSYKYSGLANDKTVHIQAADIEGADKKKQTVVQLIKTRTKTANQPLKAKNTASMKKHVRRMLSATAKEVQSYRPDLKSAALARVSSVQKSLRVKNAPKK